MKYQTSTSRKVPLTPDFAPKITFNNKSKTDQTLQSSTQGSVHLIKTNDLTDQFFHSRFSKNEATNKPVVQYFKGLDQEGRLKLQKYCVRQFNDLSLFLMFELSWELGLQELSKMCTDQLINQNYEQLNYLKYDLMKCSFYAFKKILDQYKTLSKSLQIQGLKQSDLKSIINDYCMMCNINEQQRDNLYNQFVNAKDSLMIPQHKSQVRRSMIQPVTKTKMELSVPVKPKNTLNMLARSPALGSEDWMEFQDEGKERNRTKSQQQKQQSKQEKKKQNKEKSKTVSKNVQVETKSNSQLQLNISGQLHKQIQQLKLKQSLLKSEIHQIRETCNNQENQNYLKESFEKLKKEMLEIETQFQSQNQLIKGLQKKATDMKTGSGSNKADYIFSF